MPVSITRPYIEIWYGTEQQGKQPLGDVGKRRIGWREGWRGRVFTHSEDQTEAGKAGYSMVVF